jgi:hypothetical protein
MNVTARHRHANSFASGEPIVARRCLFQRPSAGRVVCPSGLGSSRSPAPGSASRDGHLAVVPSRASPNSSPAAFDHVWWATDDECDDPPPPTRERLRSGKPAVARRCFFQRPSAGHDACPTGLGPSRSPAPGSASREGHPAVVPSRASPNSSPDRFDHAWRVTGDEYDDPAERCHCVRRSGRAR